MDRDLNLNFHYYKKILLLALNEKHSHFYVSFFSLNIQLGFKNKIGTIYELTKLEIPHVLR